MAFEELAANLGLEPEEFTELVELFVETADDDLSKLNAALEANDVKQASDAAHSLKGSSGNLGFMEISEVARVVEEKARGGAIDGLEDSISQLNEKLDVVRKQL